MQSNKEFLINAGERQNVSNLMFYKKKEKQIYKIKRKITIQKKSSNINPDIVRLKIQEHKNLR